MTLPYTAERLTLELSPPVLTTLLGLSRLGFEHPTFHMRGAMTDCAITQVFLQNYLKYIVWLGRILVKLKLFTTFVKHAVNEALFWYCRIPSFITNIGISTINKELFHTDIQLIRCCCLSILSVERNHSGL